MDPDSESILIADPLDPDPDPQHCLWVVYERTEEGREGVKCLIVISDRDDRHSFGFKKHANFYYKPDLRFRSFKKTKLLGDSFHSRQLVENCLLRPFSYLNLFVLCDRGRDREEMLNSMFKEKEKECRSLTQTGINSNK
jgi:hypothetical protein